MPCDDNFGPGFFNVKEIISHIVRFICLGEYGQTRGYGFVIASGAKQSPVIPVKTGIQEGRMAMRPYKIASSFHSSQ